MDAIPDISGPEKYEICNYIDSELIEIMPDETFDVKMQYPLLHMKHAEAGCYLRRETYDKLKEASKLLPAGCKLRILDAWRPFALQEELYEVYSESIISNFRLDQCTEEEKRSVIEKYVSEPVRNRKMPPVHTTGGAVDVTLIDAYGMELEMGTGFDAFTDMTYTACYEDKQNEQNERNEQDERIRQNRRILYWSMIKAGFTNLPSEWWHYDYGDRFWGYYTNKPAFYSGIFTKEEMNGRNRQRQGGKG